MNRFPRFDYGVGRLRHPPLPSGGSNSDSGALIDTSDPAQWGIVVVLLLFVVLVVWLASRSGAKRGARDQAQEQQAAQEQAAQAQE